MKSNKKLNSDAARPQRRLSFALHSMASWLSRSA